MIYYSLYVFFVFFVIFNLFIAIISEYYETAKEEREKLKNFNRGFYPIVMHDSFMTLLLGKFLLNPCRELLDRYDSKARNLDTHGSMVRSTMERQFQKRVRNYSQGTFSGVYTRRIQNLRHFHGWSSQEKDG